MCKTQAGTKSDVRLPFSVEGLHTSIAIKIEIFYVIREFSLAFLSSHGTQMSLAS